MVFLRLLRSFFFTKPQIVTGDLIRQGAGLCFCSGRMYTPRNQPAIQTKKHAWLDCWLTADRQIGVCVHWARARAQAQGLDLMDLDS
jgi:hypothetical protein